MIHTNWFSARRLATLTLLVACVPGAAVAQGLPSSSPAPATFAESGRGDLEQAAKYILARLVEHRQRIDRMDATLVFLRKRGEGEKIRRIEHLRERETNAFQQTLAEYRRLLGDKDFNRVIAAIRDRASTTVASSDQGTPTRAKPQVRSNEEANKPNPRDSSRRLAVARARASQRASIAARMQAATSDELRRRALAARTVATSPVSGTRSASTRPGAAGTPTTGLSGATGRSGQASNPYTRQRGRP